MVIISFRLLGREKVRWIKAILIGGLAFFLWFEGTYSFMFGKVLTYDFMGIANILAKILALILVIVAYEAKQIG